MTGGRADVRKALYMAALTAIRRNARIRAAHERLRSARRAGPWLTRDYETNALQRQYLPPGHDPRDPLVSPLFVADARGLPPAFVADAEFDGYRDEGRLYAARLREAGVPVDARVYPGQVHDFLLMAGKVDASLRLIEDAAAALRAAFAAAGAAAR